MSVTQYIGARYVPLFADPAEWDSIREYEPLTVVLYQGASYTSRQAVPAGIDITNTDFWVLTGNYNAQVEAYRREVYTYRADIDANTQAITAETLERETAIADEIQARTAADDSLSADIVAEEDARIAADSAISSEIESEADARIIADNVLDAKIDSAVAGEEAARIAADETINSRIDALASESGNAIGKYIAPTYVGDFMENRQFGSCCRSGDNIYTASPDNYENTGVIRVFSLTSNSLLDIYQNVQMGHANSMCYDSVRNRFWIAPLFTYNGGSSSAVNGVYYYDHAFNSATLVSTPHEMFAITFDHVTQNLYTIGENGDAIKIYKMAADESEFSLYKTIPLSLFIAAGHVAPWQDCAIYDGTAYFTHPEGTTYLIKIDADEIEIFDTVIIGAIDSQGYWRYGEVEGLEFSADGILYNARNAPCGITKSGYNHAVNCSFVTSINTKNRAPVAVHHVQGLHGTFNITQAARNKFTLGRTELRSLAQLDWLLDTPGTVSVPSGETIVEDIPIRIGALHNAISFNVAGNYTTEYIEFDGGILGIFIEDRGVLTFTANREAIYFYNNRVVDFRFRNRGTVSYAGSSFTRNGYANVNTSILQMTNPSSMVFGSNVSVSTSPTFMIGNAKIYQA